MADACRRCNRQMYNNNGEDYNAGIRLVAVETMGESRSGGAPPQPTAHSPLIMPVRVQYDSTPV